MRKKSIAFLLFMPLTIAGATGFPFRDQDDAAAQKVLSYEFKIFVVDAKYGDPVPDANIEFFRRNLPGGTPLHLFSQTGDAEGKAVISYPQRGIYTFSVAAPNYKIMTKEITIDRNSPKRLELRFPLDRVAKSNAATLHFTAADNLLPIGDALITVAGPGGGFAGYTAASGIRRFVVGESGEYTIIVFHNNFKVFHGKFEVPAADESKEYHFQYVMEREDVRPGAGTRRMVVRVKAKMLNGTIRALKGAMVRQLAGGDVSRIYLRNKTTDADGIVMFQHDALVGSQMVFAAECKGFSSKTETSVVGHAAVWDWTSRFGIRPDDYGELVLDQIDERTTGNLIVHVEDSKTRKPVLKASVSLQLVDTVELFETKITGEGGDVLFALPREALKRPWRADVKHEDYQARITTVSPEILAKDQEDMEFMIPLDPKNAADEGPTERTFIVAVKGKQPGGGTKGLSGAAVTLKVPKLPDEMKKTDALGMTEFTFATSSPYTQSRSNTPLVVRVAASADGYQDKEISVEFDFTLHHDSVEIVLESKAGLPLAVLVHGKGDKPVSDAVVQVRRKTETGKTEIQARTDGQGRAIFYLSPELARNVLFAAVSHPLYEDRWSDIPEFYTAPPGEKGDFIVYLTEKVIDGNIWELDKVVDDPQHGQGQIIGGPKKWTVINRSGAMGEGNIPPDTWTSITISGEIPTALRPGMAFDISITVSGRSNAKGYFDQDAGLAASGIEITPEPKRERNRPRIQGGTDANGVTYSQLKDTVTYHCRTTKESLSAREVYISPFIGGGYTMASYIFKKRELSKK